ncbi:MAG: M48 family metallopeptidase [Pseudohongiellaceae bacterium]
MNYGKTAISYELFRTNRKSLEIAVNPDGSVVVKAPSSASLEAIEAKIKNRARWIKRQITWFSQFDPRTPARRYVGGESHLYLGRSYRLKIVPSANNRVLLKDGFFYIECKSRDPARIKSLMDNWYRNKANDYMTEAFNECWKSFKISRKKKPVLKLQKLEKRWGSLSSKGQLTLNLRLIQAPRECIEYVITHELCHLIHRNHDSDFYELLDRTMPDWIKRKHKLEMSLA